MLSEVQIIDVLKGLKPCGAAYQYNTVDRDLYTSLDDVRPYVFFFFSKLRGFICQGLSPAGEVLLKSK